MEEKGQALRLISMLHEELTDVPKSAYVVGSFGVLEYQNLRKWKAHAVEVISTHIDPIEGQNLANKPIFHSHTNHPIIDEIRTYEKFLVGLASHIERRSEYVLATTSANSVSKEKRVATNSPKKNVIFIVHGHDEVNLHRLEKLLREHFKLNCKILSSDAGSGRTLIEKFEQEAQKVNFAFVLLTPDDQINGRDSEYKQARPNVIFELGWFYGRLGRGKVCVLRSKDTKIHSDLEGISRIEFDKFVNEKVEDIQRELVAGGLLKA